MRLAGRRALLIGAGQAPGETCGNGRATALLMAREGAQVVLVDRDGDRAEETRQAIALQGDRATAIVADVTSEADCRRVVEHTVDALGGIDILHNNAGIFDSTDAAELGRERWDEVLGVNATGMWLMCKHAIGVMRRQRGGAIVNVSSVASAWGSGVAYSASKAAVNSLTQVLAATNGAYGIRVNAIMAGSLDTPMAHAAWDREARERRAARVPLKRLGSAWDVAHAAVYLASDEAGYVTGVVLPVDGGLSVAPRGLPA